jgi:hypothetical protein
MRQKKPCTAEDRLVMSAPTDLFPVTEYFMRDFIKKVLAEVQQASSSHLRSGHDYQELTVNAAKANFKRILFIENNIDVSPNPVDYERGMRLFREAISEIDGSRIWQESAKRASLNVHTTFDFDQDRLIVEIRNNLPMSRIEEEASA